MLGVVALESTYYGRDNVHGINHFLYLPRPKIWMSTEETQTWGIFLVFPNELRPFARGLCHILHSGSFRLTESSTW